MTRPSDISEAAYEWADIFCDEHRHIEDDRELVARAYMLAVGQLDVQPATPEQAKVLDFIVDFKRRNNGVSPTYDEISEGVGKVKSGVHDMLHRMEDRGLVKLATRARSITIVGRA